MAIVAVMIAGHRRGERTHVGRQGHGVERLAALKAKVEAVEKKAEIESEKEALAVGIEEAKEEAPGVHLPERTAALEDEMQGFVSWRSIKS